MKWTCFNGHVDIFAYLIKHKAAVYNAVDDDLMTLLHYAMLMNHIDIAAYLVDGTDAYTRCEYKESLTVLQYARHDEIRV